MNADVIVVGGGIAGAATALGLSRAGVSALVIEKQAFPRDKACGEGLLPNGVAHLAALGLADLPSRAGGQPIRGIVYRAGGAEAVGTFEHGARGYGVRRLLLDALLHDAARQARDVAILRGVARALHLERERVSVTLADGRVARGRFLVGADGPRSFVRHALGLDLGPPRRGRYGLRRHFRLAPGVPMPDRVEVSFHGGFELYVTPAAPGVVGVAALCRRTVLQAGDGDKAERLAALLAHAPAAVKARLAGAVPESAPLACGPLRVRTRRVVLGPALLVGDAAGYVDAITGEGMSLALGTAAHAARALAAALAGEPHARAFAGYTAARARVFRQHALLTHAVVALAARPALAERVAALLGRYPALFARLLSANHGTRSLLGVLALSFKSSNDQMLK